MAKLEDILHIEQAGDVQVLRFRAASILDAQEVELIDQAFQQVVASAETPRLILDLTDVQHVSSVMLSALIELRSLVQDKGGRLATAGIQSRLRDLLETVRIYDLYENHADVRSATDALAA